MSGAIVVGAHANGLGVIRALAARRVPIVAISTRPFDVAQHSRWVSEWHLLPQLHQSHEALVELLARHASRFRGWAVFPTNDDALTALAQHHERLSPTYRLTVQPWNIIADLVDKDRMHALAARVGLDLPVCHGPAAAESTLSTKLRYPVLVKPLQHDRLITRFGAKLFLARNEAQLRSAADRLSEAGLTGLVFDFVAGADSEIYVYCVYMHGNGEPSEGVTVRKLRQNPPLIGGARAAAIVPEMPVLRDATIALLRRAGFRGMAFAEFKRDPGTGRFMFIEVNGRAVQFNSVLPPTGIDLVAMTWADFVLNQRMRPRPTGWDGTWIHLQADLLCSWVYRRTECLTLAEFAAPYRRPRTYAVWSARDPRPFLVQTALTARGALRALPRRGAPGGALRGDAEGIPGPVSGS